MTDHSFPRTFNPFKIGRAWKVAAVLFAGLPITSSYAGNFTWAGSTGVFSDPTKWVGALIPTGTDGTDVLTFGGDVSPVPYTASNDSSVFPFLVNQLKFTANDPSPGSGGVQTIAGNQFLLGGTSPMILQNGTGSITIKAPIQLGADLTLGGATVLPDPNHDKAVITIDGTLSGNYNIIKVGTSTFRFGSTSGTSPSLNTWFGALIINDGTIRFNNNAFSAPTALRGNPVTLNAASALLTTQFKSTESSSLRMGTLSGSAGTVEGHKETATLGVLDSIDMTISTLDSGTFGGTVNNNVVAGGTGTSGKLTVRGTGTQTFTGTLNLAKDVAVGRGAGVTLAGNASLAGQTTSAAIVLNGGTFTLDNTGTNNNNRLRDGSSGSTGLETIGGGVFSLIGNAAGTSETISRLQLGSSSATRSGALTINVTNNGTASSLTIQSYSRDNVTSGATVTPANPFNTVNFTANGGTAPLGTAASDPRIFFVTAPVLANSLLQNTGTGAGAANVGWAIVNGSDFATYNSFGVRAVTTFAPPSASGTGNATTNAALTGNLSLTNTSGYSLSTLKIAPSATGQTLDLASTGNLRAAGFILAGDTDFSITSSGGGAIANAGSTTDPRYFHVQNAVLTVSASLAGNNAPVVKAGAGLLELTSTANNAGVTQPLVINEGTIRATPGSTLPGGELRFRGGVLEIVGGTFSRQIGVTAGTLNWSGFDPLNANGAINQEQGSGGFAAFGTDATVDLTSFAGNSEFAWEDTGFVNSGHALIFGSTRANAKVTWVDNLALTAIGQASNYNAREIRVLDNPNSTSDVAVMSGKISGSLHDDFLKTGAGTLVLTSTLNDYQGATLVHEGALLVNGSNQTSFLTDVRNGATLGGNGLVGAVKVEDGGTVAPGDAFGHTSKLRTKDFILSGVGAKLAIELGGTTIGGDGINGYDQIAVTGKVTLNGGTLIGSLLNNFLASPTDLFFVVDNDGTDPVDGTFQNASLVQIGSQFFDISYTGDVASNSFTGGNDIVLRLSTVPEPGSALLLTMGMMVVGIRRRSRS